MSKQPQMRLVLATSIFARARGLLGTNACWSEGGRVLVLAPCSSVHTFGMRYTLDIAFVNRHGMVLRSERNVRPGRLLSCHKTAFVLERPYNPEQSWPENGDAVPCEIAQSQTK